MLLITLLMLIPTALAQPYQSYTYSYQGQAVESPHAYTPQAVWQGDTLGVGKFKDPSDLFVDDRGWIYIADSGNNRIVIFDENWQALGELSAFVRPDGAEDSLKKPCGVYVFDHTIYVADTDNARIVLFEEAGGEFAFRSIVPSPSTDMFASDFAYKPSNLAVDASGRMYVISQSTNLGVMAFNTDGEFESFLGAQKVQPNLLEMIKRAFATEEQLARSSRFVPTEYNNIALDEDGFLLVTSSAINSSSLASWIQSRSRDSLYAPVKRLSLSGEDVLKRTGFFPPAGDVDIVFGNGTNSNESNLYGPSMLVDVAPGEYGVYTVADGRRKKLFTYDEDGSLLYAFGGNGTQEGLFQSISAVDYHGTDLLVLDKTQARVTVFERTEYGDLIAEAIRLNDERQYDAAVEKWYDILLLNNNFDLAHVGIGQAMMRQEDYQQAMAYFKNAHDIENYSKAFKQYRKETWSDYILLIPVVAISVLFGISKLLGLAKKRNKKGLQGREKPRVSDQLVYLFRVIWHPFDGFYDIKRENRGGVAGATILLAALVLSFILKGLLTGYIFNDLDLEGYSFLAEIAYILIPFLLWCVSNWCLTSLMNGNGSFKDIYVMSCYALSPLILFNLLYAGASNFLALDQAQFLGFISAVGMLWAGFLLFCGTLTIHEYTFGKTVPKRRRAQGHRILHLLFGRLRRLGRRGRGHLPSGQRRAFPGQRQPDAPARICRGRRGQNHLRKRREHLCQL